MWHLYILKATFLTAAISPASKTDMDLVRSKMLAKDYQAVMQLTQGSRDLELQRYFHLSRLRIANETGNRALRKTELLALLQQFPLDPDRAQWAMDLRQIDPQMAARFLK